MPHKPIYVVRQESLQHDWIALETFLRNNQIPGQQQQSDEVSSMMKLYEADARHYITGQVSTQLSTEATRNLCCLLTDELAIYQALIQRAENVWDHQKQETLAAAPQLCGGVSSWDELQSYCDSRNAHGSAGRQQASLV
jgi:hypothetical protein